MNFVMKYIGIKPSDTARYLYSEENTADKFISLCFLMNCISSNTTKPSASIVVPI